MQSTSDTTEQDAANPWRKATLEGWCAWAEMFEAFRTMHPWHKATLEGWCAWAEMFEPYRTMHPWRMATLEGWCPWSQMFELYRVMLGAGATGMRPPTSAASMNPMRGSAMDSGTLRLMTEAYLIFAQSGARYLMRLRQIYGELFTPVFQSQTARFSNSLNESAEQRIMLDRLRTMLRELTELPAHESRRMQAELANLESEVLSTTDMQSGEYLRHWRYKP